MSHKGARKNGLGGHAPLLRAMRGEIFTGRRIQSYVFSRRGNWRIARGWTVQKTDDWTLAYKKDKKF